MATQGATSLERTGSPGGKVPGQPFQGSALTSLPKAFLFVCLFVLSSLFHEPLELGKTLMSHNTNNL